MIDFRKALLRAAPALGRGALSFIVALALVALLTTWAGYDAGVLFHTLFAGAAGDGYRISESLLRSIPLVFTGLAVVVSFRAGLWNIGADGQFLAGAMAGTFVALHWNGMAPVLMLPAMFVAGWVAGALWGWIAVWIRVRREVNEVITTIMLNLIAVQILAWLVHGPLQEQAGTYPQSDAIPAAARLPVLFAGLRLHAGAIIAVVTAFLLWLLLFRFAIGLRLRAVGHNPRAARFARVALERYRVLAMLLAGALAATGGIVEVSGVTGRLYENLSPGYGFTAIAVALIARLHPIGVLPAALLFGALDTAARALERDLGVSPVFADIVQAQVILIIILLETPAIRTRLQRALAGVQARMPFRGGEHA